MTCTGIHLKVKLIFWIGNRSRDVLSETKKKQKYITKFRAFIPLAKCFCDNCIYAKIKVNIIFSIVNGRNVFF